MPDSFSIQMADSSQAQIAVGMKILIEPTGVGERFASRFVGWFPNRYMILHLPAQGPVRDHLYDGKKLVVRYVSCDGQACGFETLVQGLVFTPQRLLFVDYPKRIAVHSFRKGTRLNVFLGGELTAGDAVITCYVLNLSQSGCQIELPASGEKPPELEAGTSVHLGFLLPGLEPRPYRLSGVIVRSSSPPDATCLLCSLRFQDVPEADAQALEAYIAEAHRHLGSVCTSDTLR